MSKVTRCARVSMCGHSWGIAGSVTAVAVLGLALALPQPVQAKTFNCGAGDVPCLIDAIRADSHCETNGNA